MCSGSAMSSGAHMGAASSMATMASVFAATKRVVCAWPRRIWKHKTFAWYWLPRWKGLLLTFYRWEIWLGFPHFWHTERNWGHFNKKMAKRVWRRYQKTGS